MTFETVKGYSDYTGDDAKKRQRIKEIVEETFRRYNFEPAETPVIEDEKFVKGENSNDEAVSDVYKLQDKGERKLALRYEFTFQLKRLANNKKLPYKRYQIGYVFRDEPITGNRVRQITQCDIDVVGSTLKDEAEILKAFSELLEKLGIKSTIKINNRKLLNEILEELKIEEKYRPDVIREIDKLDKLSKTEVKQNLKKYNAEKALEVFEKPVKYFEKYKSYQEIKDLLTICDYYNLEPEFTPYLARGLGYYNGTIFEIKTKEIKETVCGGGSYLVNGIQSTGISVSIERLFVLAKVNIEEEKVLIISLNEDKSAIELAKKIRELNIPCSVMYNKVSKALDYANSYKIKYVLFVGEDEVKKKKFKLKDMASGKEKLISEKDFEKEIKLS
ncbi:Histidine--tRNA ligase [uncultured archaeon]|nr:Histidine--tRNA ligase [uncultured archaeon]